jgi:hypothetical protein
MGTSINQRSPATPNWHAVIAAYNSDSIPIPRIVQELWRAATNQPIGNLAADLGAPIIARCFAIALNALSREEALSSASREVALSGQASLAADIAQRAVVQSFRPGEDRANAFVQSLFSEAGSYLVSRDLPGYVGMSERLHTVSDAIAFKNEIRQQIIATVRTVPTPAGVARQPASWQEFVAHVVTRLTGRG